MLSRTAKVSFYFALGPLMRLNGWRYRYVKRPKLPAGKPSKVHLGPGQNNYLDGWTNLDANIFTGKCDVWADLRNPLPFNDSTVDALYSYHVIEHLPHLAFHFREAYRCLRPGGVYRVGGPNGDSAIRRYLENDADWFSDFPDSRKSIGGKLDNFIFCRREHLTILTLSFLEELMTDAGFRHIRSCLPARETYAPEIFLECLSKEDERDFAMPHTLVVEGEK